MQHTRNKLIRYLNDNHSDYMRSMMPDGYTINEVAIGVMRMQSAELRRLTHQTKANLKVVK